ncbi:hypothetical protein [Companilactobacillus bobalius]|uniref:Uncharacterized protein n=2 Tax=Companilactobacillus bobalius TaxID=2801451 RepID=A0A202FED0_9LACO|nr:hypothetical protein [Companilactobacillus bobalius]KAE9557165.1 hypothetical protein ATN92_18050 [Companilactobacillus bobalius]KRK82093.1 hypothetical protein FC78_GL000395 [Companilactobacillus bobalius DSM 19674]OVE98831.1 hypothetical protein LKACC16343_00993 [Companilactobacillus bobalius]GEO58005.1 hypothetical protein LBO01_11340 [Companilactobacillus paralimentarius]
MKSKITTLGKWMIKNWMSTLIVIIPCLLFIIMPFQTNHMMYMLFLAVFLIYILLAMILLVWLFISLFFKKLKRPLRVFTSVIIGFAIAVLFEATVGPKSPSYEYEQFAINLIQQRQLKQNEKDRDNLAIGLDSMDDREVRDKGIKSCDALYETVQKYGKSSKELKEASDSHRVLIRNMENNDSGYVDDYEYYKKLSIASINAILARYNRYIDMEAEQDITAKKIFKGEKIPLKVPDH